MHRILAFAGISLLLLAAAPAALAASAPLANKTYYSDIPNVSITLGKTSSVIAMLYASCTIGTQVKQSWSAVNVPLSSGGFKIDERAQINGPSGKYRGTVSFTGTFSGGEFQGSVELGGSSCAKASYTAKALKGHGGGANG